MSIVAATRALSAASLAFAGAILIAPTAPRADDLWPSQVQASYDVDFNGINVGTYDFSSTREGHAYHLQSTARLSLLLGALHWTGDSEASGQLAGDAAKPKTFTYNYRSQAKSGAVRMAFDKDEITQVLLDPPSKFKPNSIPVQPAHLKNVLDPLTAALAISSPIVGDPCARRIPIYDGAQRFDLVLSHKGQIAITDRKPTGQPTLGHVCRVKYQPISGYRPDDWTMYMARNNDMEIILRPLAGSAIFIPYQVNVPTMLGRATITARRVLVTTNSHEQIALQQ